MRDLMISGVRISGGMSVVIFILGAGCGDAAAAASAQTSTAMKMLFVFMVVFLPSFDSLVISLRVIQLRSGPPLLSKLLGEDFPATGFLPVTLPTRIRPASMFCRTTIARDRRAETARSILCRERFAPNWPRAPSAR